MSKVFLISLRESVSRRLQATNLLNNYHIDHEVYVVDRLAADEVNKIYPNRSRLKTIKYKSYELTNAEVGCFNSHIELWEKCLEINEPIIILEDNFEIVANDFKQIINSIEKHIDEFGIIKLGRTFDRKVLSKTPLSTNYNIVSYSKGSGGTIGYAITPKVAKVFFDKTAGFFEPVDDFIETEWRHNCVVYGIDPPIIKRSQVASVIGARKIKNKSLKITKELYRFYKQVRQIIFNFRKI